MANPTNRHKTVYNCLPEADGGGDESEGKVAEDADEGDVADGEQTDQDRAEGESRVPRVLPVHQGAQQIGAQPHRPATGIQTSIQSFIATTHTAYESFLDGQKAMRTC